jgi:hypothetical protein
VRGFLSRWAVEVAPDGGKINSPENRLLLASSKMKISTTIHRHRVRTPVFIERPSEQRFGDLFISMNHGNQTRRMHDAVYAEDSRDWNTQQEIMRHAMVAVVRVGDGRGVVVQGRDDRRVVLTAAHCLPAMPAAHAANTSYDLTFFNLIGPISEEPTIAAECMFACPIADVATLGCPDEQQLSDEAEARWRGAERKRGSDRVRRIVKQEPGHLVFGAHPCPTPKSAKARIGGNRISHPLAKPSQSARSNAEPKIHKMWSKNRSWGHDTIELSFRNSRDRETTMD